MANILYIHGFNSGKGQKVTDLENAGHKVFCPQLTNNVFQDLETLSHYIEHKNITKIVGTSLGGYYALILSCVHKTIDYYIINPSYKPYLTLKRHLNETVFNYKTGEAFHVSHEFLNDLEYVLPKLEGIALQSINFYFGTKDELLDFTEFKNELYALNTPLFIYESPQSHRFRDISLVIKHIKEFEDWENNPH